MARKLQKKIRSLQARLLKNEIGAAEALQALLYRPSYLQPGFGVKDYHKRTGYSGVKSNTYRDMTRVQGIHVFANGHAVACTRTPTAPVSNEKVKANG